MLADYPKNLYLKNLLKAHAQNSFFAAIFCRFLMGSTGLRQFASFGGVGIISAIGHYGLLIFLVQWFGADPVAASAAGALLGAGINYSLNYRYTFGSNKLHTEAALKFSVVAMAGLLLNTLLMWIAIDVLRIHYLPSQLMTTGLVFIWSYCGNRYWTFHTKQETPS